MNEEPTISTNEPRRNSRLSYFLNYAAQPALNVRIFGLRHFLQSVRSIHSFNSFQGSTFCCQLKLRNLKQSTDFKSILRRDPWNITYSNYDLVWDQEFCLGLRRNWLKANDEIILSLRVCNTGYHSKILRAIGKKAKGIRVGNVKIQISKSNSIGWYPIELSPESLAKYIHHDSYEDLQKCLKGEPQIKVGIYWSESESHPRIASRWLHYEITQMALPFASNNGDTSSRRDSIDHEMVRLSHVSRDGIEMIWNFNSRLKVKIVEARSLISADPNGFSDPYCYIFCRGVKERTTIKKKTLNPVWDETFQFSPFDVIDENDEILFLIRDYDFAQYHDDLGQVGVPLWSIKNGNGKALWYRIQPTLGMRSEGHENLGWLKVEITFVPFERDEFQKGAAVIDLKSDSQNTCDKQIPIEVTSFILDESILEEESQTSDRPKLLVRVIQARNLPAADRNGLSDPFCKVKVKGEVCLTKTIKRSLSPKWDVIFCFGHSEYITATDQVEIEVFDKDFGVKHILNDLLGTLSIPLWTVTRNSCSNPKWFQLKSTRYKVAGELQLQIAFLNSRSSIERQEALVNRYEGKVWLYELQVTVCFARNLRSPGEQKRAPDPYCVVECEGKKHRTQVLRDTINPVWNQKFKFTSNKSRIRIGLEAVDKLDCTVYDRSSQDRPIGFVKMDMAYIIDQLGYIDIQGAEIVKDFPLQNVTEPLQDSEGESMKLKDSRAQQQDSYISDTSYGRFSTSSNSLSIKLLRAPTKFLSNFISSSSRKHTEKRTKRTGPIRTPETMVTLHAYGNAFNTENQLHSRTANKYEPKGELRLRLRLIPIGETRKLAVTKLHVNLLSLSTVDGNSGLEMSQFDSEAENSSPLLVYIRCRVGQFSKDTSSTYFRRQNGGIANFNSNLYFENDVDRIMKIGKTTNRSEMDGSIEMMLLNGETDEIIARASISSHELQKAISEANQLSVIILKGVQNYALKINVTPVILEEEAKPILGYLDMRLLRARVFYGDFHRTLRTVVKYQEETYGVHSVYGDLCPTYDNMTYYIPVTDMFQPLSIEIWSKKKLQEGKISRGVHGKLVSILSFKPLELIELEAQIVFQDFTLLNATSMPAIKLPLIDKNEKLVGSLWLKARFHEILNSNGIFAANPNPSGKKCKSFSFANMYHEVSRFLLLSKKIAFINADLISLLNWVDPQRTFGCLVACIIFFSIDTLNSRYFIVPVLIILGFIVNRHHDRANGKFVQQILSSDSDAGAYSKLRVTVVKGRNLLPKHSAGVEDENNVQTREKVRNPYARVSIRSLKHRIHLVIGWTGTCKQTLNPDFLRASNGCTIKRLNRHACRHLISSRISFYEKSTKEDEAGQTVPSFELELENLLLDSPLMLLTVKRATNLCSTKDPTRRNLYVIARIVKDGTYGEYKKTRTKAQTCEPVWEECMVFGRSEILTKDDLVEVSVMNTDLGHDECVGQITIPLLSFTSPLSAEFQHMKVASDFAHSIHGIESHSFWYKLEPTADKNAGILNAQILIATSWIEFSNIAQDSFTLPETEVRAVKTSSNIAPDSWRRSAFEVLIEVFSDEFRGQRFLGECAIPLASLVQDETNREQATFEKWISLSPRFDGTLEDEELLRCSWKAQTPMNDSENNFRFGEVLVDCHFVLPDAETKQSFVDKEEAKRADRANLIQKLRVLQGNLENFQNYLFELNNTLERLQNLFNWSNPRRTKFVMCALLFCLILVVTIKSNYIAISFILFLFTEHFRPDGTLGLRFRHMLSTLPTNDDLTEICQGQLIIAKREDNLKRSDLLYRTVDDTSFRKSFRAKEVDQLKNRKLSNFLLRRHSDAPVTFRAHEDGGFQGYMRVFQGTGAKLLKPTKRKWYRRYFVLVRTQEKKELSWWSDRETHLDDCSPLQIISVHDVQSSFDPVNIDKCLRICAEKNLLFAVIYTKKVHSEISGASRKTLYLACASVAKKEQWVTALKQ